MNLPKIDANLAKGELARRSLYYFVKLFWPVVIKDPYRDNWHIQYLCDQLQGIIEKVKRREPFEKDTFFFHVPPGASKSTIFSVMAPAWAWTQDPTMVVMTGSYSAELAIDFAIKSRDIITSPLYQHCYRNVRLKPDVNNKTKYANTAGGERTSISVGGTVTGRHAHLIIIDDPISAADALSEPLRRKTNEFCTQTLAMRKKDRNSTPTAYVMQRLHVDDPGGHMLATEPDNIIRHVLPARLSDTVFPAHLKEKYIDGLLDPVRLNEDALKKAERRLGSRGAAGQLGQNPIPDEGTLWKREWFIPVPDEDFPPPSALQGYGTDWDTAYTDKQTNDANGWVVSGRLNKRIYIDDAGAKRTLFPGLLALIRAKPLPAYIEAKASGQSAKQALIEQGVPAVEVKVKGGLDKTARAQLASPPAEAGLVYVRKSLLDYLLNDSEQGLLAFPGGVHDDVNDALVQAINRHANTRDWIID